MIKFLAKITKTGMDFGSQFNKSRFQEWADKNLGKIIEIIPKEKISDEHRGYFEGALVPAYADWSENYDPMDRQDCVKIRELFKSRFNGMTVIGLDGKPERIAFSTGGMSKESFRKFTEAIVHYFEEHQIPIPDPELYKRWAWQIADPGDRYWDWLQKEGLNVDGSKKEKEPGKLFTSS